MKIPVTADKTSKGIITHNEVVKKEVQREIFKLKQDLKYY